mgnify:CR=1 FL=1
MSTLEVKELSHPSGEVIKIAAGKTLDLNSQGTLVLPTIPHAKMPSGSVLKAESYMQANTITVSNNSVLTSLSSYTFVPVGSGSKFLITYFLYANWGSTNQGFGARMYKDGSELFRSGNVHSIYTHSLTDVYMGGSWSFVDASGSTAGTGIVFELKAESYSNAAINYSNAQQRRGFTIMEIAA